MLSAAKPAGETCEMLAKANVCQCDQLSSCALHNSQYVARGEDVGRQPGYHDEAAPPNPSPQAKGAKIEATAPTSMPLPYQPTVVVETEAERGKLLDRVQTAWSKFSIVAQLQAFGPLQLSARQLPEVKLPEESSPSG